MSGAGGRPFRRPGRWRWGGGGGKYIIGGSVYVGDLGTDAEVQTTIHVGVVPSLQNRKQQVDDDLRLWAERLNEIIKNISTLEKMQKEQGKNLLEERAA